MAVATLSGCASRGVGRGGRSTDIRVQQLSRELDQARKRAEVLEQQLTVRQRETESLRAEVQQLRQGQGKSSASGPPLPSDVTALRSELAQERERRQSLESELARLKEETSLPAFGERRVRESDYLALKQELVELRRAAEEDRRERERLAAQLRAMQSGDTNAAADGAENPEQKAQIEGLQREKDQIIDGLRKNLDVSQQRAAELEAALASAKASGSDGSLRDENSNLRSRLEEQRRHTEDLEAKLRVAARVSELIFRMQAQQTSPAPSPGKARKR